MKERKKERVCISSNFPLLASIILMGWFHSHAPHWTDLCIVRGVLFPLARPGARANIWAFVLPKSCPLQVEEAYLSSRKLGSY